MNIFELNNAIKQVQEKDLDPETLKDTLESLELPRNEKLDSVANWINEDESKIDWLDKKIKRLTKLKKHYTTQSDNLKSFLKLAIENSGHESIQTNNFKFKLSNPPYSVIVPDPKKIPIDYVKTTETTSVKKAELKKDLKAGKDIPGAYLERKRKVIIE